MSCGNDPCGRCGKRVRSQGDHTCPPCAEFLGRDVRDPFWGNFASHPDARLLPVPYTRMSIDLDPDGRGGRIAA